MIIIDRKTFLKLPIGTVYCKYFEGGVFHEICIKGNSTDYNDWYYTELHDLERAEHRDGLFEDDQLFQIYSEEDVIKMCVILTKTLSEYKAHINIDLSPKS